MTRQALKTPQDVTRDVLAASPLLRAHLRGHPEGPHRLGEPVAERLGPLTGPQPGTDTEPGVVIDPGQPMLDVLSSSYLL